MWGVALLLVVLIPSLSAYRDRETVNGWSAHSRTVTHSLFVSVIVREHRTGPRVAVFHSEKVSER
jgi:hypothetical protein